MKKLWLVVPCYNEEEMIPITYMTLKNKLKELADRGLVSHESRIAFVNDGSRDRTWELIELYHEKDETVVGINLAHNRGHQNALLAGLMVAKDRADVTVSLDADLQDDVNAIDGMLEEYRKGAEIVFGVRSSRQKDTFFKRVTAEGFYKFMRGMGVDTEFNHADFRLMSRRALDALSEYGESNLFLRGIAKDIGFKTAVVKYERSERVRGESKYSLKSMVNLAGNGITSFSTKPLQVAFWLSVLCGICSVVFLVLGIVFCNLPADYLFENIARFTNTFLVHHLFFILAGVFFVGGMILLALSVLSMYIGRMYMESKERPRYHISDILE